METVTIERGPYTLIGPAKPERNAYIRVSVSVPPDGPIENHWNNAVTLAYDIYGVVATEDGTVGQHAQCHPQSGQRPVQFSLGLNLYGRPARKTWARVAEFSGQ